ncbi:hypothetical protein N658DRAFT_501997 [Parathielavia hyrcaniae]|uniref:Uncharacterized protein n=1 Tax=Parathielavia hyrcaniae TaxID=113614 RepID=A0AAN6PUX2_9PEZI|nr:hypothetical protein N658DRAFT_501997 [Parathielavia hyrcaniae]
MKQLRRTEDGGGGSKLRAERSPASTCVHLRPPASTCVHLRPPASTCVHLRPPASTCVNGGRYGVVLSGILGVFESHQEEIERTNWCFCHQENVIMAGSPVLALPRSLR